MELVRAKTIYNLFDFANFAHVFGRLLPVCLALSINIALSNFH